MTNAELRLKCAELALQYGSISQKLNFLEKAEEIYQFIVSGDKLEKVSGPKPETPAAPGPSKRNSK